MLRGLLKIPMWTVKVVLWTLLIGVLLYFGLTRTQVGRDGLKTQLEHQFDREFEGQLRIGKLTGNLARDLYATDVELRDDQGRTVATIDSLMARPTWRSLLSRQVDVRSLHLFKPEIQANQDSSGSWNFSRALARTSDRDTDDTAWSFSSSFIQLYDGELNTRSEADAPEYVRLGHAFDWRNSTASNLDLEATLEWTRDTRLLDVQALSGFLDDLDLPVQGFSGQFVHEETFLALNAIELGLGASQLSAEASLRGGLGDDQLPAAQLYMNVHESTVDFDELQRAFPALSLRDRVHLTTSLRGPLNELQVENFQAWWGDSRIALNGDVAGWPDLYEGTVSITDVHATKEDVDAVYPTNDFAWLERLSPLEGALTSDFRLLPDAVEGWELSSENNIQMQTSAGSIAISGALGRSLDGVFDVDSELTLDGVDPARWSGEETVYGDVSGRISLAATGVDLESLEGEAEARLGTSTFRGFTLDALALDAAYTGETIFAYLDIGQFPGSLGTSAEQVSENVTQGGPHRLTAQGSINLSSAVPAFQADVTMESFDFGHLSNAEEMRSRVTSSISIEGAGNSWESATGSADVSFGPSVILRGEQPMEIDPFDATVHLESAGKDGKIGLAGDLGTASLTGDLTLNPLTRLTQLWRSGFEDRLAEERAKEYNSEQLFRWQPTLAETTAEAREAARNALTSEGLQELALHLEFDLMRPEVFRALLPTAPPPLARTAGSVALAASQDELHATGDISALRYAGDQLELFSPRASFSTQSTLDERHRLVPTAEVELHADSLRAGGQMLGASQTKLHYAGAEGYLHHTSERQQYDQPLDARIALHSLPDRNRLTLESLTLETGQFTWENSGESYVDLFTDAVVVPSFELRSPRPSDDSVQRFHAHGALSTAQEDTLHLNLDEVGMQPVAELLLGGRPLGGVANGALSLTNLQEPELTGSLQVADLSYDDRLLGTLQFNSQYDTRGTGIEVNASVTPAYGSVASVEPDAPPREHNDIRASGTINLPTFAEDGTMEEPSALDLSINVNALSAFFFDYIFPDVVSNVAGTFTGSGQVTGPFTDPTFDADLNLSDGYFDIPEFNLAFDLEGPVGVSREGITLDDVAVSDATGGDASVYGLVAFNEYEFFSFDLEAVLDDVQIMNVREDRDLPFYGQIWASGPVSLTGPVYEAMLSTSDARTSPRSEVYIPVTESGDEVDPGFIVFADDTSAEEPVQLTRRRHLFDDRPPGERSFLDGLDLDLNFLAPEGSTVNLVFDPLLGEVVRAVGSGRIQLQRQEGEFFTFGTLDVSSGDYLFTAGEVFVRRFSISEGSITWDGDPIDATLDIQGAYRTRASRAGLPGGQAEGPPIPVLVILDVAGRVSSPQIDLRLELDARERTGIGTEQLQALFNQPGQATELATSVLVTNSFLLTTETSETGFIAGSAFNSVSQLVGSQLNRYINEVLPNVDVTFGVQGDENVQDLDVTYGLALRLMDERLIIRGQGVYSSGRELREQQAANLGQQGMEGEVVVEVRLSSNVSVEAFFRREGDLLDANQFTNTTGGGISYQREFTSFRRLFSGSSGDPDAGTPDPPDEADLPPPTTTGGN